MNIEGYLDGLPPVLDHTVDENFLRPENSLLVLVASAPEGMLKRLPLWTPLEYIEK